MKSININSIYICIFSFSILISCNNTPSEKVAEVESNETAHEDIVALTSAQSQNAGIELGHIEKKQISGTIKVNGVLDVPPQQLVSISVPLGGFLKNTTLLQGSRVKKGQVIATIENLDFIQIQQDYLEAKSQLELAKVDYERQQELAKENVNSQKVLQQAKSNYTIWEAKHNALREKLRVINIDAKSVEDGNIRSSINLYSPIEGYVTQVNVNIGKYVNPTDVLFEIVDTEHLHAELIVFEKDVPRLRIGQKLRFTLANETKERMATVYLIGREISTDRTIRIHCHIDEEDKEFLPGMYLTGLVETGSTQVPALPDDAIISYQGKKYIFIASEEKEENHESSDPTQGDPHNEESKNFRMVEIETSNSELGFTEVSVPDSIGNSAVVIKGAYVLLSKMKNSEEEGGHAH
ncbi:efflux RND transporter periplasmic adaptor subunit [Chryseosolibacter indicus]|uniref:Efflux RND transporter periplasmic adaptor subunit n=1 Tax=Chryseosolibacter indicus TaxID=2782351 RepID=A0ABS5VQP6_9BACT|nr:efflux RND transporter periplasmic adaptor subunit [Chryseosolibacter indicus]MBT1703728.1 efflux RND transporter periplasmic adaptor subunit [Chryseosolibacter indicus]